MNNLPKIAKIFYYIFFLSLSLWLGSYASRIFTSYQLFEPTELLLKSFYNSDFLYQVFYTINPIILIHCISFIIMILSFTFFLLFSKLNLKINGWLFISTVFIYLSLPFEIYLMTIDYNIFKNVFYGLKDNQFILQLIIKRIKVLSSFPLIEILFYCAILFLFLFRPLTKKISNEN